MLKVFIAHVILGKLAVGHHPVQGCFEIMGNSGQQDILILVLLLELVDLIDDVCDFVEYDQYAIWVLRVAAVLVICHSYWGRSEI